MDPGKRDAIHALVVLDNVRGAMRVGRTRWGRTACSERVIVCILVEDACHVAVSQKGDGLLEPSSGAGGLKY